MGALLAGAALVGLERQTVAQSGLPLVNSLTYLGAFSLPNTQNGASQLYEPFSYGGSALGYNPANNSLYIVGNVNEQLLAEISIPAFGGTATILQNLVDPTGGRLPQVNPQDPNSKRMGGTLVSGSNLIVSAYSYYDGLGSQALTHFVRPKNLSDSTVTGPLQVGTMAFCTDLNSSKRCGGFYSGYMGSVPSEWQAALGGPALTGNGSLGVISRTSYGPAIFAFDPNNISPTGAVPLLYYPESNRTLGNYEGATGYWGGSDTVRGVAIVPGTSTVMFFGRHGETYCYGYGTNDPALDRQPNPGQLDPFCYDPTDGAKGVHGYPYNSFVWLYDLNDLAKVRAGTLNPWSVLPYTTLKLTATMGAQVGGAAIDPATGRIYIAEQFAAGINPVIRVYQASFTPAAPEAPAISLQPVSNTRPSGSSATFGAAATGSPSPTFQWELSTDAGNNFTNLTDAAPYSGTTTTSLTIASVTPGMNDYRYRAKATNASGVATSNAATLTVSAANAPGISTQPVNASAVEGSNTTFSVAASGGPNFQWQVSTNGGTTFTDLTNTAPYSGTTTATLTLTGVTTGLNAYRYRAVATNGSGSATSNAATLTVTAAGSQPPSIVTAPANVTALPGANVTYSVEATGSPTYQWQWSTAGLPYEDLANSATYSGVTTTTLSVTGVTAGMSGYHYRVVATNASGSATSVAGMLTVSNAAQGPSISTQPLNSTTTPGTNVTFGVVASGSPTPAFQWQESTDGGTTFTNLIHTALYRGETTATLTLTGVTTALNGARYKVIATNASGSVTSSTATLTVSTTTGQSPTISTQPTNASAVEGSNATFTVAATGSPTHQWQVSTDGGSAFADLTNAAPYSGATTATLTVTFVTTGLNAYKYRAVATNESGFVISNAASLTVTAAPPPTFSDDPITVGTTAVKAVHITQLRQAVDVLRVRQGLAAVAWTNTSIVVGQTMVRAVHLAELRAALQAVYSAAGRTPPTYTRAVVTEGTSVIARVDVSELRAAILAVW